MKNLLKQLTETFGPSGYEDNVRKLVHAEVKSLADEIKVDALGNLIARKRPAKQTQDTQKVMIAAHMDEIGIIASHIDENGLERAAIAIGQADALLIGAGAGMGVDSGLPDFRGPEGFWRAYPPYAKLGLRFEEMASPDHFESDPPLGWGFYGHRTNLYRQTRPHEGFAILGRWADRMEHGGFVFKFLLNKSGELIEIGYRHFAMR